MALSGSFYTNVGSHWRLQGEWTATQNTSLNQSTITLKTYWMAIDSYGAISSSATKSGSSTIEGTVDSFSGAGLAGLSANQKKLLQTQTKTVTHSADGTMTDLDLAISFSPEVTLGGTYYGTVSKTATASLNSIPRDSSLTSSASWTAGGTVTFSISRASSSYTHNIDIKVNGVLIKQVTGIGTSYTWTPTATEQENVFKELAKDTVNFNQATSIVLTTKSGSTTIGDVNTYAGTVSSPVASTTTSSASFNIGDAVDIGVTRADSDFTHTMRFYVGTTLIHTKTAVTTSYTWTPTAGEITNMYNATPTSKVPASKVEIDTFFGATKVRATTSKTGTATVTNSNPTFAITGITAKDTNSVTNTIKGVGFEETIIQSKSTVSVTIPVGSRALPINGANFTGKTYSITLDGRTLTGAWSSTADVVVSFGTISAGVNQTLTISITDSRGNTATVTKTVTVMAYVSPVLTATAKRKNGFENDTVLTASGSVSAVTINSVNKNTVKSVKYRYRKTTEATSVATWVTLVGMTVTPTGSTYVTTAVTLILDNTLSYYVDIVTEDQLGTTTKSFTVTSGQPIFFVDSVKKSVGVGKFPTGSNTMEVAGTVTANNLKLTSQSDASATGTGHAITIGDDLTGQAIKIDSNEVSSFLNGVPAALHISPDGGDVTFNNSAGPKLVITGGEIVNEARIIASLTNGWVHYSTTDESYIRASYWKDKNGMVHVTGMIKNGTLTNGTSVLTLPVGYRPAGTEVYVTHTPLPASYNSVRMDVHENGTITIQSLPSASWISLAGIHFKAEN